MKFISSILLFLLFASDLNAQAYSGLELNSKYTYVLPHNKKIQHLAQNHFCYFEGSYFKKPNGKKKWHHLYNYPITGLTVQYNNFGNNPVLGSAFAVYPFIKKSLGNENKFCTISLKFGGGLAYLSQKFDKIHNPKNLAISTNLNICINLAVEFEHRVLQNWSLFEAISLTHYSNGAVKMPNIGINLPSLSFGLKYYLHYQENPPPECITPELNTKKNYFSFIALSGINEMYPAYGKKLPAFSLSTAFNRKISKKQTLNINFDLFYNSAVAEKLKRDNIDDTFFNVLQHGITIGHENIFDKTIFTFQIGRYLYTKNKADGYIYNRVGFKRFITDNFFLNLTFKSHLFVADYLEWGAGFKL